MPVYFDNNASSPVLPEVLDAMLPALRGEMGNASSIHSLGQAAKAGLERARQQVADFIHARAAEIVFTSGGTEADNLAIHGVMGEWMGRHPAAPPPHIITTRIEHHAVLNTVEELERRGHPVTYVAVNREGRVSSAAIAAALRPDTALVSVMLANNETGVMQPIAEVAAALRAAGSKALLHTDAIQAAGKIPLDVAALGCDLLSLSAHKFHGPAGAGALYLRRGVRLRPQIFGGRHERERRAGSENLPGILGMGAAAAHATHAPSLAPLRDRLEQAILASVPGSAVNGDPAHRVPNTSNLRFAGVEGEALVIALDLGGFCVSTGAACSSGALEPSHVLTAMGLRPHEARGSLRFSLGHQNTTAEVDALAAALPEIVARLRRLAQPLTARTA